MKYLLLILGGVGAFLGALLGLVILGMALGGVLGWIFEWIFPESFTAFQAVTSTNYDGFTTGAALGWFGGFFKGVQTNTSSSS